MNKYYKKSEEVVKMPSFKEIEEENNPKNTIIKYTRKLHEKTGRNTILYYSSFLTTDNNEVYIDSFDSWP